MNFRANANLLDEALAVAAHLPAGALLPIALLFLAQHVHGRIGRRRCCRRA